MSGKSSREIDLTGVLYPEDLLAVVAEGFDSIVVEPLSNNRFLLTGDPDEVHYVIGEVSLQAGI